MKRALLLVGLRAGLRSVALPTMGLALVLFLLAPQEPAPLPGVPSAGAATASAWWLAALLLVPLVAATAAGRSREEGAWLSALGVGWRGACFVPAGLLVASILPIASITAALELGRPAEPMWRLERSVDLGGPTRIPAGETARLQVRTGERGRGARLSVTLASAGGAGPTAFVRAWAAPVETLSEAPGGSMEEQALVDGRARVPILVSDSSEVLLVTIENAGPADVVVPRGRMLALETPVLDPRRGSLEFGLVLLSLISLVALASRLLRVGLGITLATVGALTVALGLALLPGNPARGAAHALATLAEGRLAPIPGLGELWPLLLMGLLVAWPARFAGRWTR